MAEPRTSRPAASRKRPTTDQGATYLTAVMEALDQRPDERLPVVDYLFLRAATGRSPLRRLVGMDALAAALDRLAQRRATWSFQSPDPSGLSREQLVVRYHEASRQLAVADEALRRLSLLADSLDEDGDRISPPPTTAQLRAAMRAAYQDTLRSYPSDVPQYQRLGEDELPDEDAPSARPSRARRKRAARPADDTTDELPDVPTDRVQARRASQRIGRGRVHRPSGEPRRERTPEERSAFEAEWDDLWPAGPVDPDEPKPFDD